MFLEVDSCKSVKVMLYKGADAHAQDCRYNNYSRVLQKKAAEQLQKILLDEGANTDVAGWIYLRVCL